MVTNASGKECPDNVADFARESPYARVVQPQEFLYDYLCSSTVSTARGTSVTLGYMDD